MVKYFLYIVGFLLYLYMCVLAFNHIHPFVSIFMIIVAIGVFLKKLENIFK